MDISDNYEQQQQQQQQQQAQHQQSLSFIEHQQQQQQQQQMQLMQYDNGAATAYTPAAAAANGFSSSTTTTTTTIGTQTQLNDDLEMQIPTSATVAIPLPAPPVVKLCANDFMTIDAQQQTAGGGPEIDIDSLLLQKFSCLGTTDHEDLIQQFQCIMNNQINKDSAKFFLEMSNWNLQTAVGCYLDFSNLQTLPSMKIVEQSKPNLTQQAWRLQNDGTEMWPNGCYLMSTTQQRRIEVPAIKPGETCDILADIPPQQPAVMWRLCTPNGWYFGEPIWMIPQGTCNTMEDLHQRMSQLITTDDPTTATATTTVNCGTNTNNTTLVATATTTNNECFPQINIVISPKME